MRLGSSNIGAKGGSAHYNRVCVCKHECAMFGVFSDVWTSGRRIVKVCDSMMYSVDVTEHVFYPTHPLDAGNHVALVIWRPKGQSPAAYSLATLSSSCRSNIVSCTCWGNYVYA